MEHLVNVEWYGLGHRGTMAHAEAGFAFHVAFWHARISTWEIGKRSARDRQGLAPTEQHSTTSTTWQGATCTAH